jgi:hypothetical protein
MSSRKQDCNKIQEVEPQTKGWGGHRERERHCVSRPEQILQMCHPDNE